VKGVSGNPAGRFKPGESGNPGGQPRGFLTYLRERCLHGEKLVDLITSILDGTAPEMRDMPPAMVLKYKLEAATWMADRAFPTPRPKESETDMASGTPVPMSKLMQYLTPEMYSALYAAMMKAMSTPDPPNDSGVGPAWDPS
jgi:hypothetical protein